MGGMKFAMVAFLVLLGLFIALDSQGADFYQYETDDGTIVMTDDPKSIPESFQETVRSRSFEELGDVRWTPVTGPGDLHVPTPLADEKNPNRQETCDQPVRFLESEWRRFGDRTKQVFIVRDKCGNVVMESFSWPELQISR